MTFTENKKQKISFDPGFSKFASKFPDDAIKYLEEIAALKQNHQRKFAFTNLENQIIPIIKDTTAFYLGCILWGSYVFWKYKTEIAELEGNTTLLLSEEDKNNLNYCDEIDYVLKFIEKFEKAAKYYHNRSSRINPQHTKYIEIYKQFVILNNHFKTLQFSNEIKLPAEMSHFEQHSEQKLDDLKQKIYEIINSEKNVTEEILNLGLYN